MNWFFIALIAPILWSVTNHIDKYLLNKYLRQVKLTSFIIVAAIFIFIVALTILVFKPSVLWIEASYAFLMIAAGVLFTFYLFPYYQALVIEEASIVVPMFQMIPILGFILAYFFLGERLSSLQVLAGAIIISGSVGLSLELGERIRFKKEVFFLMLLASLLVSLGVVLYKFVAIRTDYWTAIFWEEIGLIASALFLLSIKSYRENFIGAVLRGNRGFMMIMAFNETLNISAGLIVNYAYLLAPIALVQFVGSSQPLFVLVLGIILSLFLPQFGIENTGRKFILQKIVFIGLILLGSYLLFTS